MGMRYEYDMTVIGGGSAGLTASGMSAVLGAKTALIESRKLGGDCTWFGCIPSKSLLKAAKVAHQMRTADRYGLTPADVHHEFSSVLKRVHAIREQIYRDADAPPNMENLGVEVLAGVARFLDPHTIELETAAGQRTLTSRYFVVATGSTPRRPKIDGADRIAILTNETLFELESLPRRLLILGAGPIGMEMAQAFRRLGSEVSVVDQGKRILSRDDEELTAILAHHLQDEGIQLLLDDSVVRLEPGMAVTKRGQRLNFDVILSATGRQPNIERLNLTAAGVETNEKGVIVNRHCRSTAKHIYACGDVIGKHLFTHMAEHTAKVAVTNAILHWPTSTDDAHVPWCTFTDPELATVGRGEQDLKKAGIAYHVHRFPFTQLDRAITESDVTGLVKVFASKQGRILGVTILGTVAGEMIAEYAMAMRAGVGLGKLASTIHPYPTYALANRRAADTFVTGQLTPGLVGWIKRIFGLRGGVNGITHLNSGA